MNESDKLGDFLVKLIPFIPPIDFTRSLITDDFNILFKHIYEMTHTFFYSISNQYQNRNFGRKCYICICNPLILHFFSNTFYH